MKIPRDDSGKLQGSYSRSIGIANPSMHYQGVYSISNRIIKPVQENINGTEQMVVSPRGLLASGF